jgi:hypothetical protein
MLKKSKAIRGFDYDSKTKTLEVTFTSGRTYAYLNVEPKAYAELLFAKSKGRYFLENIRGKYRHIRVGSGSR